MPKPVSAPSDASARPSVTVPAEVNMADVARRAGVSIATVSRTLRDKPGVGRATADRVLEVVREMQYVVSPEASQLSRRETGRVAVVVPNIDVWFPSTMVAHLELTLRQAALDVLIYQVRTEQERRRFFRELPARRKVDAVVLVALPLLPEEEQRLDLLGVQVVVAGGRIRDFPHVLVDDHSLAVMAVDHLVDLGHTRIAMIRTSDTDGAAWSSDLHRTVGYRDALAWHGLATEPSYVVTQPYGIRAGADAVGLLLDLPNPPTAALAYSDEIAVSALRGLQERGLSAPEDLALIGIDGNPLAELFGVSTVRQDVAGQARLAAEITLALLKGEPTEQSVTVVGELLARRSTVGP